jgi:hypothetical protein
MCEYSNEDAMQTRRTANKITIRFSNKLLTIPALNLWTIKTISPGELPAATEQSFQVMIH